MVGRALAILVLAGCGRFGFTASDPTSRDAVSGGSGDDGAIGGEDATVDAQPCGGTTHTLTDNFNDNTFDAAKWGASYEDSVTRHVEANQQLEIHIGANIADNWAGYVSSTTYQLADDRVFVEVPQVNTQGGNTIFLLWTSTTKTDGPSLEWEAGKIRARARVNSNIVELANVTYNPVTQRWWQIRERAGMLYFELSPDGVNWTVLHAMATPAVTTATVTLAAGSGNSAPQTDLVVFDNLNGGGAPPACP